MKVRSLLNDISGTGNRWLEKNPHGNWRFVRGAAKHLMDKYDLPKSTFYRITRRRTQLADVLAKGIRGDFFNMGEGRVLEPWQFFGPGARYRKGIGGSRRRWPKNNADWRPKEPTVAEAKAAIKAKPLVQQLLTETVDLFAMLKSKRDQLLSILWDAGVRNPECRISLLIDLDRINAAESKLPELLAAEETELKARWAGT